MMTMNLFNYDPFFRMHHRLHENGKSIPIFCDQGKLLTHDECKSLIEDLKTYIKNVSCEAIEDENKRRIAEWNNRTSTHGQRVGPSAPVPKYGHVYLFKLNRLYKIGLSKDHKVSLSGMQTVAPGIKYIHHHETNDCVGLERKFHVKFAEKREHGEWFRLERTDIEDFKNWKEA
jgi:hypothetical protein